MFRQFFFLFLLLVTFLFSINYWSFTFTWWYTHEFACDVKCSGSDYNTETVLTLYCQWIGRNRFFCYVSLKTGIGEILNFTWKIPVFCVFSWKKKPFFSSLMRIFDVLVRIYTDERKKRKKNHPSGFGFVCAIGISVSLFHVENYIQNAKVDAFFSVEQRLCVEFWSGKNWCELILLHFRWWCNWWHINPLCAWHSDIHVKMETFFVLWNAFWMASVCVCDIGTKCSRLPVFFAVSIFHQFSIFPLRFSFRIQRTSIPYP